MNTRNFKLIFALLTLLFGSVAAFAEIVSPVKWQQSIKLTTDTDGEIIFIASMDPTWHIYGLQLPEGGPRPTVIDLSHVSGAELVGEISAVPEATKEFDKTFNLDLSWWDGSVTFTQKFKLLPDSKGAAFRGSISYQACSLEDGSCIAPSKETIDLSVGNPPVETNSEKDNQEADQSTQAVSAKTTTAGPGSKLWAPADFSQVGDSNVSEMVNASWLYIFVWGFIGGLLALLTPCVWPMIPLTVSFFLKKSQSRRRSILDALTYGCAIVVIFLALGLAVTAAFGAGKLNDLATNAIFNLIFFALLVVFAISFFGAFEIKLPA